MTTNNSNHMQWKLRASVALSLTLFLATFPMALSSAAQAQTPATASAPIPAKASAQTPAKPATSPASEPTGGPKEGIKVHGHWTIDVRNPDGTLVSHRDFENALTTDGATMLANILGRVSTPNQWAIQIHQSATLPAIFVGGPCEGFGPCIIVEPSNNSILTPQNGTAFKNLTVTVPTANPNQFKLVLSGTATAGSGGGTIDTVRTILSFCTGANCSNGGLAITQTNIATLTVTAGQIIQVTVVISFS